MWARSDGRVAGLLLLVAIVARWQTFGNPVIGFDEQFYLLVGDRWLHGAVPYVDIFDRKPIGLFLLYAFARLLGGDGFVQYKLLALAFVVATAVLLYRIGRRLAGPVAAGISAMLYILWLNLMEGEGGQSPVFYDLPMAAAAAILLRAGDRPETLRRTGAAAMLLVGVALQIKYSVVVEGVFFGCWLIVAAWRAGQRRMVLAASILTWITCALLPTAIAFAAYAASGHAAAFVFANFVSVLGQARSDPATQIEGVAAIAGILALPLLSLFAGWRGRSRPEGRDPAPFLLGWFGAATLGLVAYGRYAAPHYAIPLLLPLVALLAAVFDAGKARRIVGIALVLIGVVAGQAVLAIGEARKGGAREAAAVARAAAPTGRGCIYVYDGYPALYMLTRSCLPTRWAFPGHLATRDEASAAALGVDPVTEVDRILATRPVAIVDDYPRFTGGNPATRRRLYRALDAGYTLAACIHTGPERVRLVYRRRAEAVTPAAGCPSASALRALP